MFKKIIDKLFLVKEISSQLGELHFRRWRLINTPWFSLCLHKIFLGDEDKHCHDHPWNFISLILKGGYKEYYPNGSFRKFTFGKLNWKPAGFFHKIELLNGPAYTLVLCGPRFKRWGYSVDNQWIDSGKYRKMKRLGQI